MLKSINWKARSKNGLYIAEVLGSIFLPVLAYMGISADEITTWASLYEVSVQALSNPYIVAMIVLGAFNATTDPTSRGVSDSKNALTYEKPNDEK